MTEETKVENTNPTEGEIKTSEQIQYSEIEQRALDMGWRPKEEFDGSEDDFIDAKEFVRRKPLFDKIESQSKEIKNVRKAIDALKEHYTAREEAAVKNALAKLRDARQEAISNSDGAAFDQIDSEIKRVEQEAARLKQIETESTQELAPEFVAWTNRNQWYVNTGYMRKWADDYGKQLHDQGLTPPEVLKKVEQAVKQEFPHKFVNPNKKSAPDVESSGRREGGNSKDTFVLTDQEHKVMNVLVSTKQMTKEEYIKQLKAMYPDRGKK